MNDNVETTRSLNRLLNLVMIISVGRKDAWEFSVCRILERSQFACFISTQLKPLLKIIGA